MQAAKHLCGERVGIEPLPFALKEIFLCVMGVMNGASHITQSIRLTTVGVGNIVNVANAQLIIEIAIHPF